jgi:hypothetical protein
VCPRNSWDLRSYRQ